MSEIYVTNEDGTPQRMLCRVAQYVDSPRTEEGSIQVSQLASYQMHKIVVWSCAGIAGNVFPATDTASQGFRHASRHGRHARAVLHVAIANPREWML